MIKVKPLKGFVDICEGYAKIREEKFKELAYELISGIVKEHKIKKNKIEVSSDGVKTYRWGKVSLNSDCSLRTGFFYRQKSINSTAFDGTVGNVGIKCRFYGICFDLEYCEYEDYRLNICNLDLNDRYFALNLYKYETKFRTICNIIGKSEKTGILDLAMIRDELLPKIYDLSIEIKTDIEIEFKKLYEKIINEWKDSKYPLLKNIWKENKDKKFEDIDSGDLKPTGFEPIIFNNTLMLTYDDKIDKAKGEKKQINFESGFKYEKEKGIFETLATDKTLYIYSIDEVGDYLTYEEDEEIVKEDEYNEVEEVDEDEYDEVESNYKNNRFIKLEKFKELLNKVKEKFKITFDDEILKNFYAAINSGNKFVILSGNTGTGKTLLSLLYPACSKPDFLKNIINAVSKDNKKELNEKIEHEYNNIKFIRVRPNFTSCKDLLGYYNPICREFERGFLYDFLVKANENLEIPYFIILDEMNLSHPEHYLSDLLSAMETRGSIPIHCSEKIMEVKENINYPQNLHIIGTINIDETVKELSPRLKSRAFYIELRADFDGLKEEEEEKDYKELIEYLNKINIALSKIGLGLGYRDYDHLKEFIKNGGDIDEGLVQKIIPRIRTTNTKFSKVIDDLIGFSKDYQRVKKSLEELKERFKEYDFV